MTNSDLIKYVNRSSYRVKVLKSLKKGAKFPIQIANESKIHQNHISAVLRQLRDKGIVEIVNPEMRKGRLYRLTNEACHIFDEWDG